MMELLGGEIVRSMEVIRKATREITKIEEIVANIKKVSIPKDITINPFQSPTDDAILFLQSVNVTLYKTTGKFQIEARFPFSAKSNDVMITQEI
jgi:hypothetical protein